MVQAEEHQLDEYGDDECCGCDESDYDYDCESVYEYPFQMDDG